MGTVISHMREEVFVYFLPVIAFFPSKADGNAHLPVSSFVRSLPYWILMRHMMGLPASHL